MTFVHLEEEAGYAAEIASVGRTDYSECRGQIFVLIFFVKDSGVGVKQFVGQQEAYAEAMYVPYEQVFRPVAKIRTYTGVHLPGRTVGECQTEHVGKFHAFGRMCIEYAFCQDMCFSASRTRQK